MFGRRRDGTLAEVAPYRRIMPFLMKGRNESAVYFEQLLDECRRVSGDADIVWVPSERLVLAGVGEWMELPLWIVTPEYSATHRTDVSKAKRAGLRFRPLAETIAAAHVRGMRVHAACRSASARTAEGPSAPRNSFFKEELGGLGFSACSA